MTQLTNSLSNDARDQGLIIIKLIETSSCQFLLICFYGLCCSFRAADSSDP